MFDCKREITQYCEFQKRGIIYLVENGNTILALSNKSMQKFYMVSFSSLRERNLKIYIINGIQ